LTLRGEATYPSGMQSVEVGLLRLYNAQGFHLRGGDEIVVTFVIGAIQVRAYLGPNPRHQVPTMQLGPPEPVEPENPEKKSRAKPQDIPPADKFPADFYTELVAIKKIRVDDEIATAFRDRNAAARDEVLERVEQERGSLTKALDFVAGVLGLRYHYLLVRTPIMEYPLAYRGAGASYAFGASLSIRFLPAHEWDISKDGLAVAKSWIPRLRDEWDWEQASEVLSWLLRAWSAEDPILEFVSLFIPLECVIPGSTPDTDFWQQEKKSLLEIVRKEASGQERKKLAAFVKKLTPPPASLSARFGEWARQAALPSWEEDVDTFRRFNKIRNELLHAGKVGSKSRVKPGEDDARALEMIAARYVSLALFGDANFFHIPKKDPAS